jgi:thioredoxin 1
MITLTSENFDEQVLRADTTVLVDFWAEWCPPCKMIAPILEQLEKDLAGRLTVAKINGDDHPDIVARYGVLGFPTLNVFRDGEVVRQLVGARSRRMLLAELDGLV